MTLYFDVNPSTIPNVVSDMNACFDHSFKRHGSLAWLTHTDYGRIEATIHKEVHSYVNRDKFYIFVTCKTDHRDVESNDLYTGSATVKDASPDGIKDAIERAKQSLRDDIRVTINDLNTCLDSI